MPPLLIFDAIDAMPIIFRRAADIAAAAAMMFALLRHFHFSSIRHYFSLLLFFRH
jgi:hypothetical protein